MKMMMFLLINDGFVIYVL